MVIQDWTALIVGSLQNLWVGVIGTIGNLIGALIVLLIGLLVASGLAALVERIIVLIKLDGALAKMGVGEYFERAGLKLNSARFFGRFVYWFFVVVFLLAATDILKFYSLSNFLNDILLYIPNVVVAILILLAAVIVANFLRKLVWASVRSARLHGAGFLATVTWWSVIIFGLFSALTQLGVAVSLINALVTGFVAMLAIAGGIAFGMGGKDYASSLINKLREHTEK